MRNIILIACCIGLLSAVPAFASEVRCVPADDAITAWAAAAGNAEREATQIAHGTLTTLAVCDPCTCGGYGTAACYEYMAVRERRKEEQHRAAMELLHRAQAYGICGGGK